MIRLAAVIFYLILGPSGSLANQDGAESDGFLGCSADELGSQCGAYCFAAMKPVLGYVKANQNRWESCSKQETRADPSHINMQLTAALKEAINKVTQSIESSEVQWKKSFDETLSKLIPRNLEERLAKIERQLAAVDSQKVEVKGQLTQVHDTLSRVAAVATIGSKFYYIEEAPLEQNWTSTAQSCRQMGGHLASVQINEENSNLITSNSDY